MRHFHNDLGHEDATKNEHYVLNRLFYINSADKYQEVEHPMLLPKEKVNCEFTNVTTIWHLAHINHCFNIKGRYEKNLKHSNIHTKEFLDRWYRQHLFGQYPNKQINLLDIPEIILKEFHIDKDEFYFANRGIEIHHPIMVKQWDNYFKPDSVLDLGCGRGPYLYFWRWFVKNSFGLELSEFAKNNAFIDGIKLGNINNEKNYFKTDLIIAFDVLEHLTDDNLDKTLKNMVKFGNKFLISVPVIENPNLEADKTHIQKKTMQEWIKLIESYGIILEPTPKDWLFWPQIIIGRKR
jgi:SAM-dependent methyltransferase